jgi:hypothetical protein
VTRSHLAGVEDGIMAGVGLPVAGILAGCALVCGHPCPPSIAPFANSLPLWQRNLALVSGGSGSPRAENEIELKRHHYD